MSPRSVRVGRHTMKRPLSLIAWLLGVTILVLILLMWGFNVKL
jgi:hypothetical protein